MTGEFTPLDTLIKMLLEDEPNSSTVFNLYNKALLDPKSSKIAIATSPLDKLKKISTVMVASDYMTNQKHQKCKPAVAEVKE